MNITQKKDMLTLFVWALAVIAVIPFLLGLNITSSKEETASSSYPEASEVFAEKNESEEIFIPIEASPIISADLSGNTFTNNTSYRVDENKLTYNVGYINENAPSVLIIHTYGTQAYNEDGYITDSSTLKSEEERLNVIGAGEALKSYLEEKGIKVIHEKTLFDKISFSEAYIHSLSSVKEHLEKNPTIKYVIDIQRDSLFNQSGNCIKSIAETERGKTAQIAFISGSDENGADFESWRTNLALSLLISNKLEEKNPALSRGVSLMPSGYGQYLSNGFMTIKLGTSGNSPTEVNNAAYYLAEVLFDTLFEKQS